MSLAGVSTESSDSAGSLNGPELLSRLVESASGEEEAKELVELKSHIRLNEAFTGVKFKSVDWEVKHTGETYSVGATVLEKGHISL